MELICKKKDDTFLKHEAFQRNIPSPKSAPIYAYAYAAASFLGRIWFYPINLQVINFSVMINQYVNS